MSVFSNNLLLGAGGQSTGPDPFDPTVIGNSVWLDGSADLFTKSSFAGNASKKVISTWVQRTGFSAFGLIRGTNATADRVGFGDNTKNNQLYIVVDGKNMYSNRVFRDIGWYHYLVSFDLALSGANKVQVYINGVNIDGSGGWETDERSTMSTSFGSFNSASVAQQIGRDGASSMYLSAYLAQYCELDGQSIQGGDVAVTDFLDSFTYGTNGSQFAPKKDSDVAALASTAGGNSFCLDFGDSADLGNDISSNNNDFTATSMAAANQTGSSPSSAFATWNPLRVNTQTQTFAEGNLRFSSTQTSTNPAATGNYGVSSGKWYWEVYVVAQGNTSNMLGICDVQAGLEDDTNALYASALMYSYEFAGTKRNNNSSASYGDSITTGDIVGIALDMDNGGVYFSKNGTFQASGDPTSGGSLTNAAFTGLNSAGSGVFQPYYLAYSSGDGVANFGQSSTFNGQTTAGGNTDASGRGNFKYSVPSGYKALTSANLSAPDYQGIDYFSPTLYEGNGTGQRVGDFVPFTDAFDVAKSAMFQHDEARALSRTAGTPSSTGGKKGTWSTWYKTAVIDTDNIFFDTGTTATNRFSLQMDASGQITFSYAGTTILMTNADLKGGGLWRNLVLKVDTSLATASARAIMYIDGVEVTSFATDARASLTQDGELGYMDSGATQFVGSYDGSSANQWDGYFAETIFLDDQFLSADSFGQLDTSTNKWVPKAISGLTLGDQGFYLAYGGTFGGFTKIDDSSSSYSGNMTNGGGLSAAFDGDITKNNAASAQGANTSSNDSFIVVNHGSAKTVTQFIAYASQDAQGFDGDSGGSTITFTLRGSTDNFSSSDVLLYTTTTADGTGKVFTVASGITSGAYQYHKMTVQTNTTNAGQKYGQLAQLEYYIDAATDAGESTGNSNNLTEIGTWTSADQFVDTPTKNFTIFDSGYSGGGSNIWTEGNTKVKGTDGTNADSSTTTFGMTGKVVFQFQINTVTTAYPIVGFITSQAGLSAINASGSIEMGTTSVPGSFAYTDNGTFKIPAGTTSTTFSNVTSLQTFDDDDVIRFEVDTSVGTIRVYFQNEGTGSFSEITGARVDNFSFDSSFGIRPAVSNYNNSIVTLQTGGQTTLASVTADYKEINQDNLDDTASKITAFAWIKNRDAADNQMLFDRVRGVGNDLHSNDTAAEVFNANTVQRFLQRGVQVGSDVEVNTASESYVLWQWLVGDSATTGSSITTGSPSLTTTGIVADADHFAVLSYTGNATSGATIAHGLSAAPELIIHKERDNANGWIVGSTPVGFTKMLRLDTFDAAGNDAAAFNDVAPSSTLITLGNGNGTNRSGGKLICYAFRSVAGVCKVGSYVGNGNANGSYISTGFKPSYVLAKSTGAERWILHDTARSPINAASKILTAETALSEATLGTTGTIDILSDGFKCRDTDGRMNGTGVTYIYLAMADIGGNGTLPPVYGR